MGWTGHVLHETSAEVVNNTLRPRPTGRSMIAGSPELNLRATGDGDPAASFACMYSSVTTRSRPAPDFPEGRHDRVAQVGGVERVAAMHRVAGIADRTFEHRRQDTFAVAIEHGVDSWPA